MELKKVQGVSKKSGKPYTAYCVQIGEYSTPLFFPTKIELMYIEHYLKESKNAK